MISFSTLAQLVIALGAAMAYIVHLATAEGNEAGAASGVAAAPAH